MTEKQESILKYLPEIMTDFPDLFPVANAMMNSYEEDGSLKLSDTWVRYVLSNYIGLKEVYANNSILPQVLDHSNPITPELIAHLHYTQAMATLNVYLFSSPGFDLRHRVEQFKEQVAHLCGHRLIP